MKETNEDILNKLKETDSKAYESALLILKEYKEKGYSSTYNDLIYKDYKEIPVTINEFINNKNYLGTGLLDKEGKQTVFPYWIKTLNKVFPDNINTAYNTILLTGAIGLGKSFFAVVCILYLLYRMMCLKDVRLHYGLQEIDVVTFSFINITMDAAKGVAWSKCQELLKSSPWFISRGIISKGLEPEWEPDPSYKISLIYGSLPRHIIGKCIFASFEDEISFQPNQDIDIQKEKAMQLISSADARMQSRFMKGEKLPTLHILASSKRTEQSFLETYIDLKRRNNSQTTLIVDEPQWVIRTDKDSPNKFYVAVGNKFLTNEVLPLNITEAELQQYRDRGYSLLQVPMGYREKFLDDIDIALTDIAGISTSNTTRYISGARWAECRDEKLKNPFTKEILEIGNGVNDVSQYYDYFDITQISKELISKPLFIHLDMSISGDKTGIAGVWIIGKRPTKENETQSKELFYQLAFSVAIKAPKGHQVSFEKNRQFIYWLKEKGFAIKGISSDTFQSADLGQILTSKGYNYSTISVDRVGADHLCLPYQSLKSVIYEKRIKTYKTTLLTDEIVQLERNNNGKIDHPLNGTIGSKDTADALCGSLWNASQHAEEYAFDYGESLNQMLDINSNKDVLDRKQVELDFNEMLKNMGSNMFADVDKPDDIDKDKLKNNNDYFDVY